MKLVILLVLIFFVACSEKKEITNLDGKKLLEQKCASCHNLEMPPALSVDELAPPMMSVAFHVHSFMTPSDESQRTLKAIEFVVDYVQNPSIEKSFCDKKSLERYGLMPSQKENVTDYETKAIASYMFEHYTPQKLSTLQKERAVYDALPAGEKLARKENCLSCHRKDINIVGPSFISIANKYSNKKKSIIDSIKNGSRAQWKEKGAVMPAFKHLGEEDLELLSKWILEVKK
ncbi:MAG: c-type cytochrome [Campylobacterota bacterium]|nr:c-type cytochrome [Campylobacterota bacterium]